MEPQTKDSRRRRVTSLDMWLDDGFEWISENARWTVGVLVGVTAAVGLYAGVQEWRTSTQTAAQAALAAVDRELAAAFAPGSEPANETTARELREKALAGYESVIRDHAGSFGAQLAQIHAAGQQLELGDAAAAEQRLATAISQWPSDAPERAVALRLRGYALERLDKPAEAAQAYADAAAVASYPGRAGSYVQAAETFARIGETARAIAQFEALTLVDPGFAERIGVVDRLQSLRAGDSGAPSAPAAGSTAPAGSAAPAAAAAAEGSEAGDASAPAASGAPAPATTAPPAPQPPAPDAGTR